jgi:hypothetical protein
MLLALQRDGGRGPTRRFDWECTVQRRAPPFVSGAVTDRHDRYLAVNWLRNVAALRVLANW